MARVGDRSRFLLTAAALTFAVVTGTSHPAFADKVIFAIPGQPPIASGVVVFVAQDQGFFKKYGVDVDIRKFENGTAAAQAVVAGSLDLSLSPTPGVIRMASNASVPVIAIWGMAHPDWILGSTDPKKNKCTDLKGQAVGVDSVGGARSVALGAFLRSCGLTLDDVKQVALGSNAGAAMVAGQINFAPLHTDDVPAIAEQLGHPVTTISTFKQISPISHYLVLTSTKDRVKAKRDQFVRVLAALIEATNYMVDPKNLDRVAQIATVTGRKQSVMKAALPEFYKIEFWPVGNDGLSRKNIEAAIEVQKKVGGIKSDKKPVPYDQLVDPSLWKDAAAMVKQQGGKT